MAEFIDDISAVADLDLGELDMPTEDEPYDAPSVGGQRTPPAGRYTLQLPTQIKVGAWPANENGPGSIEITFDPIKVINPGGPGDGLDLRFIRVSTRRLGDANASSATDLLTRLGIRPFPRNAQEWQDVAQNQLAGAVVEGVYCDWEARADKENYQQVREFLKSKKYTVTNAKARRIVLRGMKHFPKDDKGQPLSKVVFPDGPGGELVLYANLVPTFRGWALTKEETAEQAAG